MKCKNREEELKKEIIKNPEERMWCNAPWGLVYGDDKARAELKGIQDGKEQERKRILKLIDKCSISKCYTDKRDKEKRFGYKEGRDIVIEQICIEELKQKIKEKEK
jgi:hypothetical protein